MRKRKKILTSGFLATVVLLQTFSLTPSYAQVSSTLIKKMDHKLEGTSSSSEEVSRQESGLSQTSTGPDSYEVNNTREQATVQNGPNFSVQGNLHVQTDVDWYKFTLREGSNVSINLNNRPAGTYYKIVLTDANGGFIDSSTYTNFNITRQLTAGTYYVYVKSDSGASDELYTVTASATPKSATGQTTDMVPNQFVSGKLSSASEIDYFKFTLSESTNVDVYFTDGSWYSTLYDLTLLDANGAPLGVAVPNGNYSAGKRLVKDLPAGTYYWKVHTPNGSVTSSNYNIQPTTTKINMPDSYEPNNTMEQATMSNGVGSANIHHPTDVDWYKFTVDQPQFLRAQLFNIHYSANYDLELVDAAGNVVQSSKKEGAQQEEIPVTLQPGVYYWKVYSVSGASESPYTLRVWPGMPDTNEPNDTSSQATPKNPLYPDHGTIHTPSDVDYYKITFDQAKRVTSKLFNIPAGNNYELALVDSNNNTIISSTNTGNTQEQINLEVPPGTYFWKVYSAGGASDQMYTLEAQIKDANDTQEKATETNNNTFPYNQTFTDTISHGADVDYYVFRFDGNPATLNVTLNGIPDGTRYDLSLYDQHGNIIKNPEGDNSQKTVEHELHKRFANDPENGTYYLKVFSREGFNVYQPYSLNIKAGKIPVILVPGFGGTVLFSKHRDTQEVDRAWISPFSMNEKVNERLLLNAQAATTYDIFVDDRDFGLWSVDDLIPNGPDMSGAENQYTDIIADFVGQGYVPGVTLFGAGYDWRRSNDQSVTYIKNKVDQALVASGASKVYLVCHSMGGLVSKLLILNEPGYDKKISKLLTLGSPFLGAGKPISAFVEGANFEIPTLSYETGRNVAMHMPAAYQLMKSQHLFNAYPDSIHLQYKLNGVSHTVNNYQEMVDFLSQVHDGSRNQYLDYQESYAQYAVNLSNLWAEKQYSATQHYRFVGDELLTTVGNIYNDNVNDIRDLADKTPVKYQEFGDGTVPLLSALGGGFANSLDYKINGVDHMGLLHDDSIRAKILQIFLYNNIQSYGDVELMDYNQ